MSKYYDDAIIPDELRRKFNVYDRIEKIGLALGTFEENVVSLADARIASAVIQESGLVYLSGVRLGMEGAPSPSKTQVIGVAMSVTLMSTGIVSQGLTIARQGHSPTSRDT